MTSPLGLARSMDLSDVSIQESFNAVLHLPMAASAAAAASAASASASASASALVDLGWDRRNGRLANVPREAPQSPQGSPFGEHEVSQRGSLHCYQSETTSQVKVAKETQT